MEHNKYTKDQLQSARNYAAKINHELADHALDKDFGFADHVTHHDKLKYRSRNRILAGRIEAGEHDNNFTVWQRMNYFLTGKCIPFLP